MSNSEKTSPQVGVSSEKYIDIYDLWNMLVRWKKKVIVVAFVTFVVIVANAYLNTPMPVYKSTAHLSPPLVEDLEGIVGIPPEKALRELVKSLKLRAIRFRYFNENKLLEKLASEQDSDADHVFEEKFNKMLSVVSRGNHVFVSFEGTNSKLVAEWLNGFVMLANEETVHALMQLTIASRNSLIKQLSTKITVKHRESKQMRRAAKNKREERIAQLEEAVLIAEYAGIKNFLVPYKSFPLYLRGTKILRAELKVLREHKNQVPSIKGMADLQNQLNDVQSELDKLKMTRPSLSHISTMKFVQIATVSSRPINKPILKWVILSGLLSALVLGLLTAFFADFIVRAREKQQVVD